MADKELEKPETQTVSFGFKNTHMVLFLFPLDLLYACI